MLECLASIFEQEWPCGFEVLVADDASTDGSAEAVQERYPGRVRLFKQERPQGKAYADTLLMRSARGRYYLLLNDDSRLLPSSAEALVRALEERPEAACAGGKLLLPDGRQQASAWRFPGIISALLGALTLGRVGVVQSKGSAIKEVDWVQSAAMMVRASAFERVGGLDPQFFVYSDEVDWCKRARGLSYTVLYVPQAQVIHHEQLGGGEINEWRIVEFCRNRDRYLRKHHGPVTVLIVRLLTAWAYFVRTVLATLLPGHEARRYWLHVKQTLRPGKGTGLKR